MRSSARHWERFYAEHDPLQLSWREEEPACSLELIEETRVPATAAILDAGGGSSRLAAELVRRGYHEVTVLDISDAGLERARTELGRSAGAIRFLKADLRSAELPRRYDLWHDRAVFHFMVADSERAGYLTTLGRGLRAGGHLILATFGPDGPTSCSGLPVNRYGRDDLAAVLGPDFELATARVRDHTTPSGANQQFLWTRWTRKATGKATRKATRKATGKATRKATRKATGKATRTAGLPT